MRRIVLASLVATVFAVVATWALYNYIVWYSDFPEEIILLQAQPGQVVKLFFMFLIYFSLLIVLPVSQIQILKRVHLLSSQWWLGVAILEPLLFLYAIVFTPPDVLSTLFLFTLSQLIVVLNTYLLKVHLRKQEEQQLP